MRGRPYQLPVGRTVLGLALAGLTTAGAPAVADPPGAPADSPSVAAFVDASTLVRDMTRQQVAVAADGRTEQKVVVPARYCASLAAFASRSVTLPDVRWGVRTTTPVAVTRRTRLTLRWPGQTPREETLPDGMPGSSERAFGFARPGTRSIVVTLFPVGGARPSRGPGAGSVTDGTSNTILVGEQAGRPTPTAGTRAGGQGVPTRSPGASVGSVKDGTSNTILVSEAARAPVPRTVCVADTFVFDPPLEVRVNVTGRPGQGDVDRLTTF